MNVGADAIFNLKGGKLTLASYYKMPAPQTDLENCVAHNGSLIPIPGRDVEVQSWYQGGVSIVDFTDIAHPVEIGYFEDRKSTRLNSSHANISYAVFCLKKKNHPPNRTPTLNLLLSAIVP